MPKPTKQTPVAPAIDPEVLAKEYIEGLIKKLQSEDQINQAVKSGQIMKVTRLINKDGKEISVFSDTETLKSAKDLFDEKGNKRKAVGSDIKMGQIERESMDEKNNITKHMEDFAYIDSVDAKGNKTKTGIPFIYKDEVRTNNEMNRYLRQENISDWEKIALVAVYFDAGSDVILAHRSAGKIQEYMNSIQVNVAKELRSVAGFSNVPGFEPSKEMMEKLTSLLGKTKQLGEQAEFSILLNGQLAEIAALQKKMLGNRESSEDLKATYQMKYEFLESASEKIKEYQKTQDLPSLSQWISVVYEVEMERSKKQGKFNQQIEKLHDIVMGYERNLNLKPAAKAETPQLHAAGGLGMFGKSGVADSSHVQGFKPREAGQSSEQSKVEKEQVEPSSIKVGKP